MDIFQCQRVYLEYFFNAMCHVSYTTVHGLIFLSAYLVHGHGGDYSYSQLGVTTKRVRRSHTERLQQTDRFSPQTFLL